MSRDVLPIVGSVVGGSFGRPVVHPLNVAICLALYAYVPGATR